MADIWGKGGKLKTITEINYTRVNDDDDNNPKFPAVTFFHP